MEVNNVEILFIDVTFYPKHVQKLGFNMFNVLIKNYDRDKRLHLFLHFEPKAV